MKKTVWLALILMLLCVFALSACDNADTPPNNDNGQQTTDENGDNNSPENPTVCQHTFGEWDIVKQATCKEEGKRTRTCNKCSETEEESIQKSETHTAVIDEAVPATCKDTGLTEGSHCSVCNEVLVAQTVAPKTEDHTPVIDAAVPATCKDTGLTEGSHCALCEKVIVAQVTIPKTDTHSYVNGACSVCKQKESVSEVANTIGSESGLSFYTAQGDWIYFAPSATQLSKYKKNTNSVTSVYKVSSGRIHSINVVGNWIYFCVEGSNVSSSYIAKVGTDGTGFEKIVSSVNVGEMLVVKDTIYFTSIKSPYTNYAKDCAPLYSISVSGGLTKQLHDGYVSNLVADETYLYFLHTLESGDSSIYRIKHSGQKEDVIYSNANINSFVLANSKLYFIKIDAYSEACTMASISVKGGSYTTYGKTPYYCDWIYVNGNNLYYYGSPYSANEFVEVAGIIEYNMSTKKYTVLKEDYDNLMGYFAGGNMIVESYNDVSLSSISLYNFSTKTWKTVSIK